MSENSEGNNDKVKGQRIKPKGVVKPKAEKPKSKAASAASRNKIVTENTPIPTRATPTENMEVHHHPQLEHKPKVWKEYLLEGLMIFIAVMMGFIAENIREVINDNEHVRQLTSQLVQDLKADTMQLNRIYAGETGIKKKTDTLFQLLQQPLEKADMKKIQKLIAGSHDLWLFYPSSGATAAIKNELRLKQFSNSKIISYIAIYEGHSSLIKTVQDIAMQYQRSMIDPFMRQHFTPRNLDAVFNRLTPVDGQMRNLNQQDLTQLATDLVLIRINLDEMIRDNGMLKNDANSLLKYVLEQYQPGLE